MTEKKSQNRFLVVFFIFILFSATLFLAVYNHVLALIILAVVFLLIAFIIQPLISLYLMAFFLPVVGWAFHLNSLELPLIDLLSLLALMGFVIRRLYVYFFSYYPEKITFPLAGPFFVFWAMTIVSALVNPAPLGALWYSLRWILFFYLAFIVFPFNVIKDLKVLKRILILVVLGGFLVALMGAISLFLQDLSDPFFRAKTLYFLGDWIFGENYNLLAEFLIISSFLVLSLKYFYKSFRVNRFLDILFLFFVLINLLTFGRTAWLTILLQTLVYFIIYYLIIKKEKIKIKESLSVLFIIFILISPFFLKALDLQRANFSSTQNRVLLTKIAVEAFWEKPLWGHGGGRFVSLVDDSTRFVAKYGDPLDSHGVGQKLIAENGLLGTIAFLSFIFLIFRKIYFGLISNKKHYRLLLPLLIAGGGGYFYQLFNTSYYKGRVWLPIALALIAVSLLEKQKKVSLNQFDDQPKKVSATQSAEQKSNYINN